MFSISRTVCMSALELSYNRISSFLQRFQYLKKTCLIIETRILQLLLLYLGKKFFQKIQFLVKFSGRFLHAITFFTAVLLLLFHLQSEEREKL